MSTLTTATLPKETSVGMGQIAAGRSPERFKSVLGSCIGLAIYHRRLKTGVMAHIVLPDSAGRDGVPGKFADTAIPRMLELLRELNVPPRGLIAKFAGGANMFGGSGPLRIGDANVEAVTEALRGLDVKMAGQDVGGAKGRRVTFDCASGEMTIECAGRPVRTL